MRFLFDPIKEREQKLERFRQSFRILTSDGKYPPERQQRLFHACQNAGLDWEEARQYVRDDALAFLSRVVSQITADSTITVEEVAGIRKLQRRLAIPDDNAGSLLDKLYDIVERRLTNKILEYAAYVGEEAIAQTLKQDITKYDLPTLRSSRLLSQVDRQHQLARMMIGNIPVIMTNVALFHDEACHLDIPVTVLVSGDLFQGRLLVTSQRVMILAQNGGMVAKWTDVRAVQMLEKSLVVVTSMDNSMIICDDPQYVATMIASARKRYAPQNAPEPIRPGKRLS
jgi:hypothetical protein